MRVFPFRVQVCTLHKDQKAHPSTYSNQSNLLQSFHRSEWKKSLWFVQFYCGTCADGSDQKHPASLKDDCFSNRKTWFETFSALGDEPYIRYLERNRQFLRGLMPSEPFLEHQDSNCRMKGSELVQRSEPLCNVARTIKSEARKLSL